MQSELSWEADESDSSTEGSPARTSAWPVAVLAWLESGPASTPSSFGSLMASTPSGWWSRTSPACSLPTSTPTRTAAPEWDAEPLSLWSSGTSPDTGRPSPPTAGATAASALVPDEPSRGACLTLDTSESPNDGAACSLSRVLETGPHLRRYSLSPKACAGILRRANRRGRALPRALHEPLYEQALPELTEQEARELHPDALAA